MTEWQTNWPINWVGNSVGLPPTPIQTRQYYTISAVLTAGQITHGVSGVILQLTHSVTGGELVATGRLILVRPGSRG